LPVVDVVVVQDTPDRVQDVYAGSTRDYKLGGVPVIAVTGLGDRAELGRRLGDNPRRFSTVQSSGDLKAVDLKAAIEQANAANSGAAISADEANNYALTSLRILREIAVSRGEVFHIADAQ